MAGLKRLRISALLFAALLLLSPISLASDAVVHVVIAGPERQAAALHAALLEPFGRVQIQLDIVHTVRVSPTAITQPSAVGRADAELWFDLASPSRATLYLADKDRERIYTRSFRMPPVLDEVALEQLVVAARSSVQALLAGTPLGVRREDYQRSLEPRAPSPKRPEAVQRPSPSRRRLHTYSYYEAGWLAERSVSHGPGLELSRRGEDLLLLASLGARLPVRVDDDPLGVRLTTLTPRLGVGSEGSFATAWSAGAMVSAGFDIGLVQPLALRAESASAQDASWAFDFVVRGSVRLGRHWGRLGVGATFGLDWYPVAARYTIERAGQRETLFAPWTLRPLASLGLTILL